MKRILILFFLIVLPACAVAEPLAGGWENAPHEAVELPADAQAAFDEALEGLDGAAYTPVALLSTQVVAGMNYCIKQ